MVMVITLVVVVGAAMLLWILSSLVAMLTGNAGRRRAASAVSNRSHAIVRGTSRSLSTIGKHRGSWPERLEASAIREPKEVGKQTQALIATRGAVSRRRTASPESVLAPSVRATWPNLAVQHTRERVRDLLIVGLIRVEFGRRRQTAVR